MMRPKNEESNLAPHPQGESPRTATMAAPSSWNLSPLMVAVLVALTALLVFSTAQRAFAGTDTEAPAVTSFVLKARGTQSTKYTNAYKVNVVIAATDNVKVTGYYLSEAFTTPPGSAIWSKSKPPNVMISSAYGVHTVRAWAHDAAGNISATAKATIFLDPVKPNLSIVTPSNGQTLNALTRIGGTVIEALPSSGIASAEYSILRRSDCSWWDPGIGEMVKGTCGDTQWVSMTIAPTAKAWAASVGRLDVAGKYSLYVRIIDRAGNIGTRLPAKFTIS